MLIIRACKVDAALRLNPGLLLAMKAVLAPDGINPVEFEPSLIDSTDYLQFGVVLLKPSHRNPNIKYSEPVTNHFAFLFFSTKTLKHSIDTISQQKSRAALARDQCKQKKSLLTLAGVLPAAAVLPDAAGPLAAGLLATASPPASAPASARACSCFRVRLLLLGLHANHVTTSLHITTKGSGPR